MYSFPPAAPIAAVCLIVFSAAVETSATGTKNEIASAAAKPARPAAARLLPTPFFAHGARLPSARYGLRNFPESPWIGVGLTSVSGLGNAQPVNSAPAAQITMS